MNEQFTRPSCLLSLLSKRVLALLTPEKPLRGPSGTGASRAPWHHGLSQWDTCLPAYLRGAPAQKHVPGELVVVLPAVLHIE